LANLFFQLIKHCYERNAALLTPQQEFSSVGVAPGRKLPIMHGRKCPT
jgi:hypothetical protein